MQVPILSGISADTSPEWRTSYPVNLRPVPKAQGISEGFLRTEGGLVGIGTGPGVSRGGIVWDGLLYRVMGTKLVSIDGAGVVSVLGDVGGAGLVSMAYSFDRLAVASGGKLFYWDKSTLVEVTDVDLGTVLNVEWADGYFITTDGEFIVVTELLNPTSVDPLKYGSSEVDPDPVNAVRKVRNEIFAVNRYSIEAFTNVGGSGFPFQVIKGAQVHKGAVGTHASIVFNDAIAVVGGGRNESIGVHLCLSGTAQKISTREIDKVLSEYTEAELATVQLEVFQHQGHNTLMIHLPDKTACFDAASSASVGQPVWYFLASGVQAEARYRGRHFVWAYDQWNVADTETGVFGRISDDTCSHWGDLARWEFGLPVIYNGGKGLIIHSIELVAASDGSADASVPASVSAEWSENGVTWSTPLFALSGGPGARQSRLRWMRQGLMRHRRMYRFRGDSNIPLSIAACEVETEALIW